MKTIINGESVWAIPFPGSDKSVVQRTQYFNYTKLNKKPVIKISNIKNHWKDFFCFYFRFVINLTFKYFPCFQSFNLLFSV